MAHTGRTYPLEHLGLLGGEVVRWPFGSSPFPPSASSASTAASYPRSSSPPLTGSKSSAVVCTPPPTWLSSCRPGPNGTASRSTCRRPDHLGPRPDRQCFWMSSLPSCAGWARTAPHRANGCRACRGRTNRRRATADASSPHDALPIFRDQMAGPRIDVRCN